jgi:hypothetical protein
VIPTSGPNGAISPGTPQGVAKGSPADVVFTFIPDPGYHVASVTVDGTALASPGGTYTFTGVSANHTIDVKFAVDEFTITPSVSGDPAFGSIWWDTAQLVQYGTMKTFAFFPSTGYRVADVLVDGVSVGRRDFYTFTDVTAAHTISVSFELNTFVITPSSSAGGTIAPSTPQTVSFGADSPAFTMTANAGYHLSGLLVDGTPVTVTNPYTFTNVQANHSIAAEFTSDRMLPVYRFYNVKNGSHWSFESCPSCQHASRNGGTCVSTTTCA